jgi:hypothetical protein
MSSETRDTPCPAPSRFWEVAAGDAWQTGERLHVASCPHCRAAEHAIRFAFSRDVKDSEPSQLSGPVPSEVLLAREILRPAASSRCDAEGVEALAQSGTQSFASRVIFNEDRATQNSTLSVARTGVENSGADGFSGAGSHTVVHEADVARARSGFPAKLGDYELIGEIGHGGMGVVFKVRDVALGRLAALKVIINRFAGRDESSLDRFFRSARLWARLVHPSIVPIYHVGQFDGMPYVVSQLIEGQTLASVVNSGNRMAVRDAAKLVSVVADAAHFAHERGVIHRDIKPSNIIMGPDNAPILIDFGLACARGRDDEADVTFSGQVLGTPVYMSPEQASGRQSMIGPASDVYSLGATLYTLLVGRPPHLGESVGETMRLLLDVEPIPPRRLAPTVPRDLETICLKALSKNRNSRYATARALADDLRSFLDGRPIQARTPGPLERSVRWLGRHPAWACVISAAVAVTSLIVYQQAELERARTLLRSRNATTLVRNDEIRRDVRRVVNRVAEAEMRTAVEAGEAQLRDHPSRGDGAHKLAATYARLGDLLVNTDRFSEATWAYEKAVELLRRSLRVEVGNAPSQKDLADVLCNLAEASLVLGKMDHARELYREAVVLRRRLVADHPEVTAYRDQLAQTLNRSNHLPQGHR